MKKLKLTLALIGAIMIASSCNKVKPKNVEKTLEDGSWKISLFTDDGQNETNDYSGYEFNFKDDGTVEATNGINSIIGGWSVEDDDSDDDSSSNVDFILDFPPQFNFEDLSDDWDILSESGSKIELEDISGGDGSLDQLTFEKI